MVVFDIETVPDEEKIKSRQWLEYKQKKGIEGDQDAALDPAFGRVVCICAYDSISKTKFKEASDDEAKLLDLFHCFVTFCSDKQLAGHYIKGFDIPFLASRYMANSMIVPTFLNSAGKKPWEINHLDTSELIRFGGNTHMSLDACCLMLGIESPKEGEVNALGVWEAFKNKNFSAIIEYCTNDVRATISLIGKLKTCEVIQ